MNCRICGAQIPEGASHCPQCGNSIISSDASEKGTPDAPTVAATSSPVTYPPPPSFNPYDSPNPYVPYGIAPPPPKRPLKGIGLIIGIILLVLLLLGGGVAWFQYSAGKSSTNGTTASTGTPAVTVSTTPQLFTAKGTTTIVSSMTNDTHTDGDNKVSDITQQSTSYGDIAGPFTSEETTIVHPDKTGTFSGKSTCNCTVNGKSGILTWTYSGITAADGSFQGEFSKIQGIGGLATLHGAGVFQGEDSQDTYTCQLYFTS